MIEVAVTLSLITLIVSLCVFVTIAFTVYTTVKLNNHCTVGNSVYYLML